MVSHVKKLKVERDADEALARNAAMARAARLAAADAAYERNFPGVQRGAVRGRIPVAASNRCKRNATPVDVRIHRAANIRGVSLKWKETAR